MHCTCHEEMVELKKAVTVLQDSITSMCSKMDHMYAALQTSSTKVVQMATPQKPTPQKPTMTHRKASSTILVSPSPPFDSGEDCMNINCFR